MSETTEKILQAMAEVTGGTMKVECPKCKESFGVSSGAVWKQHTMTLTYGLADGHLMIAEEFSESIKALAKTLKAVAKEIGARVQVQILNLECKVGSVSITVLVSRTMNPK